MWPDRQVHTPYLGGVSTHSAASIVEYSLSPNFVRAAREVFERLYVDGVIEQGDIIEFTLCVVKLGMILPARGEDFSRSRNEIRGGGQVPRLPPIRTISTTSIFTMYN